MPASEHRFVVQESGVRLDRYVADRCPELTRSQAQKMIAAGLVTVNGAAARASLRLTAGDRVVVTLPPTSSGDISAEDISFGVLYEDDDLLVIDKPAGLPVHPAPGHPRHTLVNALLGYLPRPPDTGDRERPGIVHRLDMDTSGVMLLAKSRRAQAHLVAQFKSRSVTKAYLVLVKGRLSPERGVIDAPLERDPRHRQRMAIAPEGQGRAARTRYRVLRYLGEYSLVEAAPETGRTHQIRVHFSAIGFPVVGDATYGVTSALLSRQFLHSSRLGFRLPSTGEYVEFESALPADLEQALERLA